jgi:AraC-like DNA-binding protein
LLLFCNKTAKTTRFSKIFENFAQLLHKIGKSRQSWHTYCMETLRDRLKPLIPAIVRRELTNRDVARKLGVSEGHICRLLKKMDVQRQPPPSREGKRSRPEEMELLEAREALRREVAARTRATDDTRLSVAEAARQAHCSERTIYRYRSAK